VLLAEVPKEEVRFLLNRMSRPALTPQTRTGLRDILQEIDRARQQGYALIDEELEIGLRSIAVPLRTGRGELVAALSLSVATQRMTRDAMVETLLPEMESARRKFAELL
jgi:IclR family pca regulon transcriptional regulator